MSEVKLTFDHVGFGKLLRSDGMKEIMERHAEEIKLAAEVIAPVYVGKGDKHPGRYKASFKIKSRNDGGAHHDRAESLVYNDAPEAIYVEYGYWGDEPEHILARAAFRYVGSMGRH